MYILDADGFALIPMLWRPRRIEYVGLRKISDWRWRETKRNQEVGLGDGRALLRQTSAGRNVPVDGAAAFHHTDAWKRQMVSDYPAAVGCQPIK